MPRIIFEVVCKGVSIFTRFMRLNKNIKNFLNYFLGPVIFIWLSYSIYNQVKHQPNLEQSWLQIKQSFNSPLIFNLILVILLMIINWSLEALKWKLSVQRVQQVSFLKSFKAILSGVSFSVTTPNRIGEYAGRVLFMNEGNRLRVISLTILGSMSQLIITLLFGLTGLLILKNKIIQAGLVQWPTWINIVLIGGTGALLVLTLIYFRLKWLAQWMDKLPQISRYAYLISELEKVNATLLLQLLSLSTIRYLVFGLQYYLLFRFFGVDVNWWQAFWPGSVTFLILAIIPTIALVELGLRGEISIKMLGLFSTNSLGIGFASTSIWFINLIVPAMIGSSLILGVKIFRSKNESS